ncbi:OLC1v1017737C1 [Oldenlandia corymbosa var. corymbosa]|uniref:OLC1v1017737C1 n=1 Tax=Oldenlandia corymbosa var. corymbosa TaxID=529605 RepID=A0AAV1EA42_OLDCO|nr:OLC1v1017737C1 [Oldenlandia corymbosa var. corymbosa]
MSVLIKSRPSRIHQNLKCGLRSISCLHYSSGSEAIVSRIARVINDYPFTDQQAHSRLLQEIHPISLSPELVEKVLGHLFGAHANGIKAYEFFMFCLRQPEYVPSSDAFEKTLHILTRMRYFDKAWELLETIRDQNPSLLTLKSISIMIARIARFRSYEETLCAFERMEKDIFVGKVFGTEEFNILLRAFSTQRQMKEARSVFNKLYTQFSPNTKTMNILLLGFKESGDVTSVDLFYHEMIRRGFKPDVVTYNIRIDAYCKRRCFGEAMRIFEEMELSNVVPTLQTITTLIHGAGVARNVGKAKHFFDEISRRNLEADIGAYNALLSAFIKCRDLSSATALLNEMEEKLVVDNVTYHTIYLGLMKAKRLDLVFALYHKMISRNFVPMTRTVVMLTKFFCENNGLDLGLDLWNYLLEKGHCPHSHALDLLVTGLCSRGKFEEAFDCSKQMLERGRHMSEPTYRMLERCLLQIGEMDKLQNLDKLIESLHVIVPVPRGMQSKSARGLCRSVLLMLG